MTDNEIIAALRCCYALVGTAVECEKCQYYVCEQLCGELSKKLGRKTWTSCDIGGVCMDAANRIERLTAENAKAEADKDGRVLILPCKVGDKVWFETYKNSAHDCIGIQPHEVARISVDIIVPGEIVDTGIPVDQIGVSVFLSEAEAVAADAKPPAGNAILEV